MIKLNDIRSFLSELTTQQKKTLFYILASMFLVLFSYPLIRSTTTSLFIENFGALKTPNVWLYSVIVLAIVISIMNKFQERFTVRYVYFAVSFFSFIFFVAATILYKSDFSPIGYWAYIWKESYIVLLVHLAFGCVVNTIDLKLAKVIYGPIGALNSLAGILGGLLTAQLTNFNFTAYSVLLFGAFCIFISGLLFLKVDASFTIKENDREHENTTPLKSIKEVKKYVFLICIIIALSQFCINIANFKFNILFGELVIGAREKTKYLGYIYSSINTFSLVVQLLVVPYVLTKFKLKSNHIFIPIILILFSGIGFTLPVGVLLPVAITFVLFKGLDYSLFSTVKELLYFGLNPRQKYGAKYISDMLIYRLSKGIISVFLIFVTDSKVTTVLLFLFLFVWLFVINILFNEREKSISQNA